MPGPPPRARTPGGSPPGSTPTENAVAGSASGTSISESLPGSRPIGPNSSPPRRTACGPTPRRASCSNNQCAESDLSVRPISTCFTSLVTRGSLRPASRAAASASAATSVNPSSPAAESRLSTAVSSSSILAFGGSAHSGSGIRSIFRRFSRSEMISARKPRSASLSTVASAAAVSASSSSAVATRRWTGTGPSRPTENTSEPRFRQRKSFPGPDGRAASWPSTLPTCVPLTTPTCSPLAHSASTSSRTRAASACRSGTAVPSQSNTAASNRRSSTGGSASAPCSGCRFCPLIPCPWRSRTVERTRRGNLVRVSNGALQETGATGLEPALYSHCRPPAALDDVGQRVHLGLSHSSSATLT